MTLINQAIAITDLPPPPDGKLGWPWTEGNPASSADPNLVSISIVTPSYNQGQFIEETIRSVLLQGYANLEYIIIDGGSKDNTVEIIKKYEPWISYWVSEPDGGQSQAINRGMSRATGTWFNWLNSDDILLPRALLTLSAIAGLDSSTKWISGGRLMIAKEGNYVDYCLPWKTDPMIIGLDYPALLPQDATFFRLDWARSHHIQIQEHLHNAMDTVLYFQLMAIARPLLTTAMFSAMRLHEDQKGGRLDKLKAEINQWVEPLRKQTAWTNQLLFSLIHQRFGIGAIARFLLRLSMQYAFLPNLKHWQIAVFSTDEFCWKLIPPNVTWL